MLVLSRRVGEEIVIADHVRVRIASIRGKQVRLAIAAPDSVQILRHEIHRIRQELGCEAAPPDELVVGTARSKRKSDQDHLKVALA